MGLDRLIRSAVATAHAVTADLHTSVLHRAWDSQDATGQPTFASVVTRAAIVELVRGKGALIRTAAGEEVVARASVLILGDVAIDPRDHLTLPDGSTGPILAVRGLLDPTTTRPYAAEVWVG